MFAPVNVMQDEIGITAGAGDRLSIQIEPHPQALSKQRLYLAGYVDSAVIFTHRAFRFRFCDEYFELWLVINTALTDFGWGDRGHPVAFFQL